MSFGKNRKVSTKVLSAVATISTTSTVISQNALGTKGMFSSENLENLSFKCGNFFKNNYVWIVPLIGIVIILGIFICKGKEEIQEEEKTIFLQEKDRKTFFKGYCENGKQEGSFFEFIFYSYREGDVCEIKYNEKKRTFSALSKSGEELRKFSLTDKENVEYTKEMQCFKEKFLDVYNNFLYTVLLSENEEPSVVEQDEEIIVDASLLSEKFNECCEECKSLGYFDGYTQFVNGWLEGKDNKIRYNKTNATFEAIDGEKSILRRFSLNDKKNEKSKDYMEKFREEFFECIGKMDILEKIISEENNIDNVGNMDNVFRNM